MNSTIVDIQGKWKGIIVYGKGYEESIGEELFFELDILQDEDNIAGKAIDTLGEGASPDPAKIRGVFRNNKINFIKQYESRHYNLNGKLVVDKLESGPEIQYSGDFDPLNNTFTGNWKIETRLKKFWVFHWMHVCGGTWTMERVKE